MSRASLAIALVVIAILAYIAGSYIGPRITSTSTKIETKVITKYNTITKTSTVSITTPLTTTLVTTKLITKEVPKTKYVTTIVTKERLTTSVRTITTIRTTVLTKTVTKYLMKSSQSIVVAFTNLTTFKESKLNEVIKSHPQISPPSCPKVRRLLNELVIASALSPKELLGIKSIAKLVKVSNSPLETAIRAAKWVHDNVRYVRDTRFGVLNCVLMPTETLRLGGDCEDRALLLAAILLSTKQFSKVYILDLKFKETKVGHVEVGIDVGGEVYALMLKDHPFLRALGSDYCGYWKDSGLTLSNVTIYEVINDGKAVRVGKLGTYGIKCSSIYPPPISDEYLHAIENALVMKFNLSRCYVPDYIWEQYRLISDGIIYLPYLRMTIPIDWYSIHTPKWVSDRVSKIIYDVFRNDLSKLISKYGCGVFRALYTKREAEIMKYNKNLQLIKVKEVRPVIDVYFITPLTKSAPEAKIKFMDNKIVINVISLNKSVEVLIYRVRESTPVLGIAKPRWFYGAIPTVTADKWVSKNGITYIEVSKDKVFSKLRSGNYLLIVWVDKSAYVKFLKVS